MENFSKHFQNKLTWTFCGLHHEYYLTFNVPLNPTLSPRNIIIPSQTKFTPGWRLHHQTPNPGRIWAPGKIDIPVCNAGYWRDHSSWHSPYLPGRQTTWRVFRSTSLAVASPPAGDLPEPSGGRSTGLRLPAGGNMSNFNTIVLQGIVRGLKQKVE